MGYSGAQLLLPGGKLQENFAACRYFTHWSASLSYWLEKDEVLLADGSTDGGCNVVPSTGVVVQSVCPPCRTSRCLGGLPSLAVGFDWGQTRSPCEGGSRSSSSSGLIVSLKDDKFLSDKFQTCLALGSGVTSRPGMTVWAGGSTSTSGSSSGRGKSSSSNNYLLVGEGK